MGFIGNKQISKILLGILILILGWLVYVYFPKSDVHSVEHEQVGNLQKYQIDLDNASVTILEIGKKKGNSSYIIIGFLIIIVLLLSYIIYQHQKTNKPDLFGALTQKETEIVHHIQAGKTNQEIANALFISVSTVKTHINNIYKKLQIKSRKDLLK